MKKIFILLALGSVSVLSADQYWQPYGYQSGYCASCNQGGDVQGGYNQSRQYNRGGYKQESPYYGNGYNQRQYQGQPDSGNYSQQRGWDSQQSSPYNSQQQSYEQNQQYGQHESYSQQQSNPYDNQAQQGLGQSTNAAQHDNNQKAVSDQEINKKIRRHVVFSKIDLFKKI